MWRNFKLFNHMKQTECFAGDFMDNGLPGFVFKTMVVLRFCEKMRNY